ncbi:MAG: sulfotransferase family protein [Flammeovirgaceae bacterium]
MPVKVIGAGLGRTGTMSLKLALEYLGYGPCFHMVELLQEPQRLSYLKTLHKTGKTNWSEFFSGFNSTVDYPTCLYYDQLLQENPAAKVILTERDPEKWYESVYQTIYRGKPKGFKDITRLVKNLIFSKDMRKVAPVFMHNDTLIWNGQFKGKFEDKQAAIEIYLQHNEQVKKTVPAEQLLVFQVTEGWQPLCTFLGEPTPDIPFPRSHQRETFNKKMDKLLLHGKFEP